MQLKHYCNFDLMYLPRCCCKPTSNTYVGRLKRRRRRTTTVGEPSIVLPQKCCLIRFKFTSFSFHFLWNTACTSGRTVVVDNDSGSPVPARSEILISQKQFDKKLKSASDSGVACISGIDFIMVPVKIVRQHIDIKDNICTDIQRCSLK